MAQQEERARRLTAAGSGDRWTTAYPATTPRLGCMHVHKHGGAADVDGFAAARLPDSLNDLPDPGQVAWRLTSAYQALLTPLPKPTLQSQHAQLQHYGFEAKTITCACWD